MALTLRVPTRLLNRDELLSLLKSLSHTRAHTRQTKYGAQWVHDYFRQSKEERAALVGKLARKLARGDHHEAIGTLAQATLVAKRISRQAPIDVHVTQDADGRYGVTAKPKATLAMPVVASAGKAYVEHPVAGRVEMNAVLAGRGLHQVGRKTLEKHAHVVATIDGTDHATALAKLHGQQREAIAARLAAGKTVAARVVAPHDSALHAQLAGVKAERARKAEQRQAVRLARQAEREARAQRNLAREQQRTVRRAEQNRARAEKRRTGTGRKPGAQPGNDNAQGAHEVPAWAQGERTLPTWSFGDGGARHVAGLVKDALGEHAFPQTTASAPGAMAYVSWPMGGYSYNLEVRPTAGNVMVASLVAQDGKGQQATVWERAVDGTRDDTEAALKEGAGVALVHAGLKAGTLPPLPERWWAPKPPEVAPTPEVKPAAEKKPRVRSGKKAGAQPGNDNAKGPHDVEPAAEVANLHAHRHDLAELVKAALGPAGARLRVQDFAPRGQGGVRSIMGLSGADRKAAIDGVVGPGSALEIVSGEQGGPVELSWSMRGVAGVEESYSLKATPGGEVELGMWRTDYDNPDASGYVPLWRQPAGASLAEVQAALAAGAEAALVHAGERGDQELPPLGDDTGRKPGAQPGNDNAKGTRGKKKERAPLATRDIAGMSLEEVKALVEDTASMLDGNTVYDGVVMVQDGAGFNATDHHAALRWLGQHYKTDLDYVLMAQSLIKYKGQYLDDRAEVFKALVRAAAPEDGGSGPRFKWNIKAAGWVLGNGDVQGERPPMCVYAKGEGQYGVQFKYNADFVDGIKRLVPPGQRTWDSARKEWTVSALGANKLLGEFGHRVGIDFEGHQALAAAMESEAGEAAKKEAAEAEKRAAELAEARVLMGDEVPQDGEYVLRGLKVIKAAPYVTLEAVPGYATNYQVAVKFNQFDPEFKDRLKGAVRARWEPAYKSWLVDAREVREVLALFPGAGMDAAVYEAHGALLSESDDDLRRALGMFPVVSKENTDFQEPAGWSTHTMHDYQRKGANWLLETKKGILGFGVGLGKCLGHGTPVMMADGSIKPVQDIVNGDRVMGPDSAPRTVMGVNRGRGPLYRIEPVKGDAWVCNDVHVLTLRQSVGGAVFDIPLDQYLAHKDTRALRDAKLFRVPVEFPARATALDPYILGVWLGDGNSHRPNIHTVDEPVIEYLVREAPKYGVEAKVSPQRTCTDVYMTTARGSRQRNVVLEEVRRCWVGEEKRIPADYLRNGREARLLLLAGLIDTDGHLTGGCYEVITKFPGLRDDVLYLARSLGFAAYASRKVATIKATGFEGVYWRVVISGELDQVPCRVARKQAPPRRSKKLVTNTGFTAVPLGEGDYYGFTLDGDGRFLLGDFTVTHNTNISIAAACKAQEEHPGRPAICVVPGKRLYGWKADIEAAMPGKKVFVFDQGTSEREQIKKAGDLSQYDFIVVTYRMQTIEKDHLVGLKPSVVIYDEAHKLKNKKAQQSQAAAELSAAAPYVWDLTATPMPNRPDELMALIQRNHGKKAIPSKDLWNRYYKVEKSRFGSKVVGIKDPEGLKQAIAPFVFMKRGDDADVNLNLPPLRKGRTVLEQTQFEPDQRRAYNSAAANVLAYIKSIGGNPTAAQRAEALVRMGKLEQIAITPELVDPTYSKRTPKIQEMLDEIENREGEFPGKGHVVFCRFAQALQIAKREALADGMFRPDEIAIIDGATSKPDVQRIQDALNAGRLKLVLCSDAAMEGLNFQRGSNHMVHLDTPWSPYMQEQRDGRVYRQGQQEPVRIQTIAQGPIDQHKDTLSMRKERMNAQLFGKQDEEAAAAAVTVADLMTMAREV
jgi:superfamily II DNA or RNA helicase